MAHPDSVSLREIIAESIVGQKPSWKNALSRDIPGVEKILTELEQDVELETPPPWFAHLVYEMTNLWFDPKSFESEEMYEKLGIKKLKKYIPTGEVASKIYWKFCKKNALIEGSSEDDLKNFEKFTRIYEIIHLAGFAFISVMIGLILGLGRTDLALSAMGMNILLLLNVYPIFLQRYNRIRLYRAINKTRLRGKDNSKPEL